MKRRTVMKFAGSLALSGIGQAFGQVVDFNDAINRAGRQRMLSQRTAKAYLAAGQGVLNDRTHEILSGSIALFDRQLDHLVQRILIEPVLVAGLPWTGQLQLIKDAELHEVSPARFLVAGQCRPP